MSVKVTEYYPPRLSNESIIPLIESIACDIPRVMIVNVQNKGEYVLGIPRNFSVEIPALVSMRGIDGIQTDGLPAGVLAYALHDCVAPWDLELAAYASHSKQILLDLILMDHWTHSEEQANALLEDILNLPEHAPMRQYYR
jgi:alpha-galactosidase